MSHGVGTTDTPTVAGVSTADGITKVTASMDGEADRAELATHDDAVVKALHRIDEKLQLLIEILLQLK